MDVAAQPNWFVRAAKGVAAWSVRTAKGLAATVAGPIFVKELRVASRRRRSYMLRFAYLALMTVFVAITWAEAVHYDISSPMYSYRSSDTGRMIVATLIWFQFVSLQLITVIVMSTSISDEVYHGTMGVLMTTPISNFQVILGKLSSKLLQLAILIVLSVPLLSVVRVFGGVPWNYVLGASCITLSACAFAGAITLFYSVLLRRAYTTILAALGTLFFLYVVLIVIVGLVWLVLTAVSGFMRPPSWISIVLYLHPWAALGEMTDQLSRPGFGGYTSSGWPINCLFMLGLTACISLICVPMVRRVSLKRAMGGSGSSAGATVLVPLARRPLPLPNVRPMPDAPGYDSRLAGRKELIELVETVATVTPPPLPQAAPGAVQAPPLPTTGAPAIRVATPYVQVVPRRKSRRTDDIIHRVKGSAIVWKETRGPWVFRGVWSLVSLVLCLSILALVNALVGLLEVLPRPEYHAIILAVLTALTIAVVSVTSATTISTEKESRSLPVLLTTPMGDGHIILGKFVGVLRRCIGSFIPMTGHLVVFVAVGLLIREGFIRPVALLHVALIVAPMLWFYISSGLYFGSKFKKTTAAVVLNLGLALVLLVLAPIVTGPMDRVRWDFGLNVLYDGNPVVQAFVVIDGGGWPMPNDYIYGDAVSRYRWPSGRMDFWATTLTLMVWALLYFLAGSVFLWRARANLRKKLF